MYKPNDIYSKIVPFDSLGGGATATAGAGFGVGAQAYPPSKNPSTAAASYNLGGGGFGAHAGLRSGDRLGQQFAESFDLDIMMPPDVASIDSDLSKINGPDKV